ncbi:type IX secretion system protein PorD [Arcticibacter tournemirensis]
MQKNNGTNITQRFATLILLLLSVTVVSAQDLNARVQILSPQVQNTNKRVLGVLEGAIRDFLNGRKWSADILQNQERIDCSFVINIIEWDGSSNFKAEAQIVSSRPVYGTSYNSTILNLSDKEFNFSYTEGQPLDYSDQVYNSNLTSLLAYYAYIITGLDYDTFSKFSGSPYYTKAQTVVNNAQNTSFPGWKAFETLRNRYWLVENFTNKAYTPLRQALYDYHRNGLDVMAENQAKGREQIIDVLPQLQKIDRQRQGSMLNQVFFTAKADELVNIISQAAPKDRMAAYNILSAVDPSNITKYELLRKN